MSRTDIDLSVEFRNERYRNAAAGLAAIADHVNASVDGFGEILSIELKRFLKQTMFDLAERHSIRYPNGTTNNTLSRRSGKAYLAIRDSWDVTGTTFETITGTITLPRKVAFHETGGVIKAKKAKYLTIPLPAALRSNGTPIKRKARDWKDTFVAKSKKGNLLIFQKRGSKIVPLYALKRSVKIPPRLGLSDHVNSRLPRFVDKAFEKMLDSIVTA